MSQQPTPVIPERSSLLRHWTRDLLRTLLRLGMTNGQGVGPRYTRLDPEALPPHIQRDLGFRDGRDPRYEPAETR